MSRSNQQFQTTKTAEISRSSFDLSHSVKTTIDGGRLYPVLVLEVLPGDTIKCRANIFGRMATLIKPIMENLYLESFFFFSATRNLWDNFPKFMGEQINPGDSIDYAVPVLAGAITNAGKLGDYMGIPPNTDQDQVPINALPFRMYAEVYNFWFRDQNLVDSLAVNKGDGPDISANSDIYPNSTPRARRKRRDYLTSVLPWPQKGEAVSVGLGALAPVVGVDQGGSLDVLIQDGVGGSTRDQIVDGTDGHIKLDATNVVGRRLFADLENASGFTINELRESFQIQKLLERDARGGTRYPEILMSHFSVRDPGLLVHQRPVFLGGGHSQVNINPVQQTQRTDAADVPGDTPQGNLSAYGTVSGRNHGFTASFTEHGYVMGIINIRADLTYQQGLERYWQRSTRYDYFWPALAHLGEQAVLNREIYVSNDPVIDDAVFGYIPRYDEYRYKQSQITSIFRSVDAASLDVWHLAQDFAALPALNKAFIEDAPPIDRVSAVPGEPDFLIDIWFNIRAARPLPLYATPGLIDHF